MEYTIEEVLEKLKLTPTELSKRLGVSYRSVRFWVTGERQPSKPVMILINQMMKGK